MNNFKANYNKILEVQYYYFIENWTYTHTNNGKTKKAYTTIFFSKIRMLCNNVKGINFSFCKKIYFPNNFLTLRII